MEESRPLLKFIYSEKATKILRNLPLTFDYSTYGQKLGEDFAKFCGLIRIYELYCIIYILWQIGLRIQILKLFNSLVQLVHTVRNNGKFNALH